MFYDRSEWIGAFKLCLRLPSPTLKRTNKLLGSISRDRIVSHYDVTYDGRKWRRNESDNERSAPDRACPKLRITTTGGGRVEISHACSIGAKRHGSPP